MQTATVVPQRTTSVRMEPSPRRVRAQFAGATVADSKHMMLIFGAGHVPFYFFPQADVRMELLKPSDPSADESPLGGAAQFHVVVGDRIAKNAARVYREPPETVADLRGYMSIDWKSMDAWYEEDEEVTVHARDPYHRIDVRESSRHVRIDIEGVTIADTHRPRVLFETNILPRYYIPKLDIRMDLLTPSAHQTACPYKGEACYWTVDVNGKVLENVVWSYPYPYEECARIVGLLSFYNERVDVYVDGELEKWPTRNRH